jgi:hypothetical protein
MTMSKYEFCSYCGRPPKGKWAGREHRVCRTCELGIVLRSDADLLSLGLSWRPFLIVDRELTVQAVSRLGEEALNVDEVDVIGCRLDEVMIEGEQRDDDSFELRAVSDPESRFIAQVHTCGSPRAALVVLEHVASIGAQPRGISAYDHRVRASYRGALMSA